jgi:hypothetical protein
MRFCKQFSLSFIFPIRAQLPYKTNLFASSSRLFAFFSSDIFSHRFRVHHYAMRMSAGTNSVAPPGAKNNLRFTKGVEWV